MNRLLIVLFFVIASLQTLHAGNEGGAGGDGVLLNGNLYLIDLVEAGVESNPYIDESLQNDPAYAAVLNRVERALALLGDPEMVRSVALKLLETSKVHVPLALTLLQTIEAYQWILVNHGLVDVKDEDMVLEIGAGKLVQLAIRRLHSIRISRDSWTELETAHRVALVFHEATYGLVVPHVIEKSEEKHDVRSQSSAKAREVVGKLFTKAKVHLLDAVNSLGIRLGDFPATGSYFEFGEQTESKGWSRAYPIHLKEDIYQGVARDPLKNEVTPKQICEDMIPFVKIYCATFDASCLRGQFSPRLAPHRFGLQSRWIEYLTRNSSMEAYLAWESPMEEIRHSFSPSRFSQGWCESRLAAPIKQLMALFERPQVFLAK